MHTHTQDNQPIVVGLDIGTTKTVMIVGKRNQYGKIETIAFGKAKSEGMQEAEVVNLTSTAKSIKEALQNCYESNKESFYNKNTGKYEGISEVFVGIAGKHITCTQHSITINRKNTDEIITDVEVEHLREQQFDIYVKPGNKIINVVPKKYVLDNKHTLTNPVGCVANKIDIVYNVIIGEEGEIKKMINSVKMAGLEVAQLYLQPLASALAVLNNSIKETGVAIVDIGGGTTDIAVFKNGSLQHTAVINYAGNFITKNIYNSFKLLKTDVAEELKVSYGTCIPDNVVPNKFVSINNQYSSNPVQISTYQLSLVIADSVKNIIHSINNCIENSGIDPAELRGGIYMTGGSATLRHLKQLVTHETCLNAEIGFPSENLDSTYKKEINQPENATCFGLILYGFEQYDKKIKLLLNETENESEDEVLENVEHKNQNEVLQSEATLLDNKNSETNSEIMQQTTTQEIKKDKSIFHYITGIFDVVKNEFDHKDQKL